MKRLQATVALVFVLMGSSCRQKVWIEKEIPQSATIRRISHYEDDMAGHGTRAVFDCTQAEFEQFATNLGLRTQVNKHDINDAGGLYLDKDEGWDPPGDFDVAFMKYSKEESLRVLALRKGRTVYFEELKW